jgi:hypothetical protein
MLSCFCVKVTVSSTFTTQGILVGVHCYVHQPTAVVVITVVVAVAVEVVKTVVVVQESL